MIKVIEKPMKILVTGSTGFIGNYLISFLLKNKSNQIIASSRNINEAKKFNWFHKVKYIEHDLSANDETDLYNYFEKPDKLIHLAWDQVSNVEDASHVKEHLSNQFRFIKTFIEGGLKELIVTGSCFEYGMLEGCLKEDAKTNPVNPYGVAKNTLRESVVELRKNFDFDYKWIRIFYIYGEGQSKTSLFYQLNEAIKNKDKQFNMSGGEQLRDYLSIDEVVKYISLIVDQNIYMNKVINCCSGKPISVKDLVKQHLKDKGCNMYLNLGYYPYREFEPMSFWGDRTYLDTLLKI